MVAKKKLRCRWSKFVGVMVESVCHNQDHGERFSGVVEMSVVPTCGVGGSHKRSLHINHVRVCPIIR